MASAESSDCELDRLFWLFGSTLPSASKENNTVHLKPCLLRTCAIIGMDSSDLYSSSPARKTRCLPLPGPSPPAKTRWSAGWAAWRWAADKHMSVSWVSVDFMVEMVIVGETIISWLNGESFNQLGIMGE